MENILSLDWRKQLKAIEGIEYINEDFFIYENRTIHPVKYPFKMDMTVCCICLQGEARGRIDMQPYAVKASSVSISMPEQIMEHESNSEDFRGIFILMSRHFTENLFISGQASAFLSVRNQPVITLTQNQMEALLTYCRMIQRVIRIEDNPNRIEIVKHLTIAFFYGLGYYFHQAVSTNLEAKTRNELLLQDFLKDVQTYHQQERRIEFYANKLYLTPKYLSRVIKDCSGKSAAEWIDEYVILTIKALLKSTNMTIQQISNELDFPSQSFFGKYFKRLTGLSPSEYREQ